ncbi:MAG: phosphate ABC transporter permease PstA [Candidatus Aureabacteria bacterium]|nr:phosphate ABC transporter permease PstA [Candidatus Auribacterota bacterium]
MRLSTRKLLDRSFTGLGFISIVIMTAALLFLLTPIFIRGSRAFLFRATVEHRLLMLEKFKRGNPEKIQIEVEQTQKMRRPVYDMMSQYEKEISQLSRLEKMEKKNQLRELKKYIENLLGPAPGETRPVLWRDQYGQTRWERALAHLQKVLYREKWDYSDPTKMGQKILIPRTEDFKGTSLENLFPYIENNLKKMLSPRLTFYWRFLTDKSYDAHFFGGIWPEMLGTLYLTLGAMIFAIPMGVIAAIYLTEYAKQGTVISVLRTCISTLAGVPSIVFGLFGLAFFINTIKISESKSVLAGSMTLALLILPTVIRASEEAIRAVPVTYKEAALSLGASKWHTVLTVILPAALPGILTGIVISMGRAAGETAPIIFTAAVSVGKPLKLLETFTQPTPALPWNIYNLATEHEAVDEIRHVQFGMVLTLVLMVLVLNMAAIILRARISKKLKG